MTLSGDTTAQAMPVIRPRTTSAPGNMPLASILKELALKFTLVLIRKLVVTLFNSPVFNSNFDWPIFSADNN